MLRIAEIMTRDVLTLAPEDSLKDAMQRLAERHVSGAPVVSDNGTVVGVVSLTDLAEFAASTPQPGRETPAGAWDEASGENGDDGESLGFYAHRWDDSVDVVEQLATTGLPSWSSLDSHTVSEVMSRHVRSLPPRTPVEHAAQFMREAGIHRVLVMEDDHLVGVVSTRDISDAVADHRLVRRQYVFERRGGERFSE